MMLEEWQSNPHELWFNTVYMLYESSEQFLWKKKIVLDQLHGKYPMPTILNSWATGVNVKFGLVSNRFLGAVTLCDVDVENQSAQIKILIDPRIVPKPWEIKQAIEKIIEYAFVNGWERIYGYLPLTGGKIMRYWEKVLKGMEAAETLRRVGIERHAIRTSKRRIGRILFEALPKKE